MSNIRIKMRESSTGNGAKITVEELLDEIQMNGKCSLFAKVTMEPEAVLGYHEHHGETETYYILSGEGVYDDNGVKSPAKAGDVFFCKDGGGHGISCKSAEPLVFMALIIKA